MALRHLDVSLTGGTDRVIAPVAQGTTYPCCQIIIFNLTGNGALLVGGSTLSASSFGYSIAANASLTLGPFSGVAPMALSDLYLRGTNGNVAHIIYITP